MVLCRGNETCVAVESTDRGLSEEKNNNKSEPWGQLALGSGLPAFLTWGRRFFLEVIWVIQSFCFVLALYMGDSNYNRVNYSQQLHDAARTPTWDGPADLQVLPWAAACKWCPELAPLMKLSHKREPESNSGAQPPVSFHLLIWLPCVSGWEGRFSDTPLVLLLLS